MKPIRVENTKKQKRMPSLIKCNYNVSRLAHILYNDAHDIVVIGSHLPELTNIENLSDCAVYSQL